MMNRKNDDLHCDDSAIQLDKNISRLVKLADDSNIPGRKFTQSLIDNALSELKHLEVQKKREQKHSIVKVSWPRKAMGWAAMVAAACGTALAFVLSILLEINAFFTVIVFFLMFANWMAYFGGLIL